MTLEQLATNPMQVRTGSFERDMYRRGYSSRLDTVLVRENNRIDYTLYKRENKNEFWLYMKLPSEVIKDFYYDVVVKFKKPEDIIIHKNDPLKFRDIEIFSNDPAFAYNMAYVINKNNMFISELSKKMNPVFLKSKPTQTNPNLVLTYCKSIIWTYLIAERRGLFVEEKYIENLDLKRLLDKIEDTDSKIQRRQELGEKVAKEKKKEKAEKEAELLRKPLNKYSSKGPNFNKDNNINFSANKKSNTGKKSTKPNFDKSKRVF